MKKTASIFLCICMLLTVVNLPQVSAQISDSDILFQDNFEGYGTDTVLTKYENMWDTINGSFELIEENENHYVRVTATESLAYPALNKDVAMQIGSTFCISAAAKLVTSASASGNEYVQLRNGDTRKTLVTFSTSGISVLDTASSYKIVSDKSFNYEIYVTPENDGENSEVVLKIWGEGVSDLNGNALEEPAVIREYATFDGLGIAQNEKTRIMFNNSIKYSETDPAYNILDDVKVYNAPDATKADLKSISVNGTVIEGFDKNTTEYDFKLMPDAEQAQITAEALNASDSVVIDNENVLQFPSKVYITVKNEIGITKTYAVNISKKRTVNAVNSSLEKVRGGAKAMVTMVYDDGFISTAEFIDKQFEKYGLTGTSLIITSKYANDETNLVKMQTIAANGRVDIGSHSSTHATISDDANNTEEQIQYELADSKTQLEEWFPNNDIITFAAANNQMSARGFEVLKANYYAARLGNRGYQSLDPTDGATSGEWYNLKMQGIGDVSTVLQRNGWIDNAISTNTWLFEMWHGINEGYQAQTEEDAIAHYRYMAQKQESGDIWVANYTEAVKYIRERQASVSYCDIIGENAEVEVVTDTTNLPAEVFDYPLTVKAQVPAGWNMASYELKGETVYAKTFTENGDNYAYIDVCPNTKVTVSNGGTSSELSSLSVNGIRIEGFTPDKTEYTIACQEDELPISVGAKTRSADAELVISNENVTAIPAQTTVTCTDSGNNQTVYTINFVREPSDDSTLSSIMLNSELIEGFSPSVYNYSVTADENTALAVFEAEASSQYASVEFSPSDKIAVPGKITITVTAENSEKSVYTVDVSEIGGDNIILMDDLNSKTVGKVLSGIQNAAITQKNLSGTSGVIFEADPEDANNIAARFFNASGSQQYLQINCATGTGVTQPLVVKGKMMIPNGDTTSIGDVVLRSRKSDNSEEDYNFVKLFAFTPTAINFSSKPSVLKYQPGKWVEFTIVLIEDTANKKYSINGWVYGDGVLDEDSNPITEPVYLTDEVSYDNESLSSESSSLNCRIMYRGIVNSNSIVENSSNAVYLDDPKIYTAGNFKMYCTDTDIDAGNGEMLYIKSNHDIDLQTVLAENIVIKSSEDKTAYISEIVKTDTEGFAVKFSSETEPGRYTLSFSENLKDISQQSVSSSIDINIKNDDIIYEDIIYVDDDFEDNTIGKSVNMSNTELVFSEMNKGNNGYETVSDPKDQSNKVLKGFNNEKSGQNQQLNMSIGAATSKSVAASGRIMRNTGDTSEFDINVRGNDYTLPRIMLFSSSGEIYAGNSASPAAYFKNDDWIKFAVLVTEDYENKKYTYKIYLTGAGLCDAQGNEIGSVVIDAESNTYTQEIFDNNAFSKLNGRILLRSLASYDSEGSGRYGMYVDDVKLYSLGTTVVSLANQGYIDNTEGDYIVLKSSNAINPKSVTASGISVYDADGRKAEITELTSDLDEIKFKLGANEAEGIYRVNLGEEIVNIAGEGVNAKNITFEAYDNDAPNKKIETITIESADGLEQTTDALHDVLFTANTVPGRHIDESLISWYVNGEKQSTVGKTFALSVDAREKTYVVYAATEDVKSNEMTVTVTKAPVVADETVVGYDSFETYTEKATANKSNSKYGSNVASQITIEKIDNQQAMKIWYDASEGTQQYVQLRVNFNTGNKPLIQSGRMYLQNPQAPFTASFRANQLRTAFMINKDGQLTIGSTNVLLGLNKWFKYTLVLIPNESDLTQSRIKLVLSGEALGENDYFESDFITFDASDIVDAANPYTMYNYAGVNAGTRADNGIYIDDYVMYSPNSFTAQLVNTPEAGDSSIEILLNHEPSLKTVVPENISVTGKNGKIEVNSVVFDKNNTRKITVDLARELEANESCEVEFLGGFNDVCENQVNYFLSFTTREQTAAVSILVSNGTASAQIGDGNESLGGLYTGDIKVGTAVKLTALPLGDNTEFMYWKDVNSGRIVSLNEQYEFTVGSDTNLKAMFTDNSADRCYVIFKNINGAVLSEGYSSAGVKVPNNPFISGYTFNGWYINGEKTEYKAGDTVTFASEGNVQIKAGFSLDQTKYTVTFVNGDKESVTGVYNEKVTVTAVDKTDENLTFAYWTKDGVKVSYDKTYSFFISGNASIEAVYSSEVTEAESIVTISAVQIDQTRIGFFAERSIKEGYSVVEAGILMGENSGLDIKTAPIKAVSVNKKNNGQFTVRKANLKTGDTYFGRAYVIYSDGVNVYTIYSDEISKTIE